MKIFVLTEGGYSMYHIILCTVSREKAEHLAKIYECEIEEYEDGDVNDMRVIYRVTREESTRQIKAEVYLEGSAICKIVRENYWFDEDFDRVPYIETYVKANTDTEAIRIAQDLFAHFDAQRQGL